LKKQGFYVENQEENKLLAELREQQWHIGILERMIVLTPSVMPKDETAQYFTFMRVKQFGKEIEKGHVLYVGDKAGTPIFLIRGEGSEEIRASGINDLIKKIAFAKDVANDNYRIITQTTINERIERQRRYASIQVPNGNSH
jgi:hypothetical protein